MKNIQINMKQGGRKREKNKKYPYKNKQQRERTTGNRQLIGTHAGAFVTEGRAWKTNRTIKFVLSMCL